MFQVVDLIVQRMGTLKPIILVQLPMLGSFGEKGLLENLEFVGLIKDLYLKGVKNESKSNAGRRQRS